MFDYKHTEIIEYVKKFPTFSEKIQTSRLNKKKKKFMAPFYGWG